MNRAWPLASVVACIGCASILGIPNDSPSFCSTNPGHSYCEDFDLGDPSTRWSYVTTRGGANWAIKPSDDSPPSLMDLSAPAIPASGGGALAGFDKEFTNAGFGVGLHIEADMRFVTQTGAGFEGETGIMLITDKQGGCVALAATPQGLGLANLVTPLACSTLTSGMRASMDAGSGDAGGGLPMGIPLGPLPPLNKWFHMIVDVTPDKNGLGSGMFTMNVVGEPTGYMPATIQKGTLLPGGDPLVGFSTAPIAGTSPTEVQYDNVVIDLKAR